MSDAVPLRALSIASLFPDATRPNFGVFVERSLLEAAKQPGVELTIVAPIGVPLWPLSLHPRYRHFASVPRTETWKGVTVHRPRFTAWPGTNGRFAPGSMARAIRKLVKHTMPGATFDVVDAQFFFPDGPAAIEIGAMIDAPVSIKARGADISYWAKNPATAAMVRDAGQKAAGLIAVSEALKQDMVECGMPPERIIIHYTGLDTERFRPRPREDEKQRFAVSGPVISTVGALIPRKGQEIVIRALPELPGVTYLVAGLGADEAKLRALATSLGVADRVRFLGSVPHADVPSLLAASDAMILVSESEGLANAWLEALACGAPIVISNVGGAPEIAPGSEVVHIVERTPEAVADAVRKLLATPPSPDHVAATVNARFSWHKNARELVAHWRKLAGH